MAEFPAELSTGMVHGRFIVAVIDGEDEGQDPDVVPAQGKVAFKASVGYIPVPVATGGPVTVMKGPIMGVLDSEGYLCTPNPATGEPMYRGVRLVSTDDPDMAVTDWTWSADYRLEAVNGNSMQIPAHSFALPSGSELDLTTLVKVPSSPGYGLPQAEAAANRAEAHASNAMAIAQSVRDDADAGLFGGGGMEDLIRFDNTVGMRVFVTNPANTSEEVSVYSNTGLAQIVDDWDAGSEKLSYSSAVLYREGSMVTLLLQNTPGRGAVGESYALPTGYLPSAGNVVTLSAFVGDSLEEVMAVIVGGAIYMTLTDGTPVAPSTQLSGQLSWHTADEWPATLPGRPN